MKIKFFFILMVCCSSVTAEIYKYKNSDGKWAFSDKQPQKIDPINIESIKYSVSQKKEIRPYIDIQASGASLAYRAHNPLPVMAQCFLKFDDKAGVDRKSKILAPESNTLLYQSPPNASKRAYNFWCVIGDPYSEPLTTLVLPPFLNYKPMRISQGFKGRFSHNSQPSLYAVDIGMPVGTKIIAVKKGMVISAKDGYASAGVSSPYFLDKANYIDIMHDDGTYALYAHLLLGSVKVKSGQLVDAGQVIGLSGNTGYSTGPHLHFVIRHNDRGRTKSIPFKFSQPNKSPVTPKRGVWLLPVTDL